MKRIQTLTAMVLLVSCFLILFYSNHLHITHSHITLQWDIQKNLITKNIDVTTHSSEHDSVTAEPDIYNVSISDSFRQAIPQNGAYWNRLLHSTIKKLNKKEYTFGKDISWSRCREMNQEVLRTNVNDFVTYPELHQNFLQGMKCRHPPLLIDQPHKCNLEEGQGENPIFLLMAIKSIPRNFEQRQAVRETWGREGLYDGGLTVRTVFLLGSSSPDEPDLTQLLSYEAKHFGDLLQWDFHDSFFNLTLKEHAFYRWALTNCPHVAFVFKGDDDVFVNTKTVLSFLQSLEPPKALKTYVGHVISAASPLRDPKVKYYVPLTFYEGPYPPYAGGGGYIFSGVLLRPLYYFSHVIPFFPIDDVYTGMCFQALGILPQTHKGFYTFGIQDQDRENMCIHKQLLLVHQRNPRQIKRLWKGITSTFLTC